LNLQALFKAYGGELKFIFGRHVRTTWAAMSMSDGIRKSNFEHWPSPLAAVNLGGHFGGSSIFHITLTTWIGENALLGVMDA
jgi:hypothetical protein